MSAERMPMRGRSLDRDKLSMVPRDTAVRGAHAALSPMNRMEGEELLAAVSLLFAAVVTRVRVEPQEAFRIGSAMLRDQDFHTKTNDSLQSLRDFAGVQVAGDKDVVIS